MKIPGQLYQFKNEKAIIVASGAEVAKIYIAKDGGIDLIWQSAELEPKYLDNEGFFETRSITAGITKSGSVLEKKRTK